MIKFDITPITKIAQQFADAYKQQLEADGKRASGNLQNSIRAVVDYNGTILSIIVDVADYWRYVEYGRKPGKFPPVDKIREWIRIKPVLPTADSKGRLPSENTLAFLIARKIATKGIPATHSMSKAVTNFDLKGKIYNELEKQIIEEIKSMYKKH